MRDYISKEGWLAYRTEMLKGFPYCGSAAFKLEDCSSPLVGRKLQFEPSSAFLTYWIALELQKEGTLDCKSSISEILEMCKDLYEEKKANSKNCGSEEAAYKGYKLEWKSYRLLDSDTDATWRCVLPFRATEDDKKALRKLIYIPYEFNDNGFGGPAYPYTDSLKIYTTTEKTFIYHSISYAY